MRKKVIEFAEKSGFLFWDDENHTPPGDTIDWSSSYDNELDIFYKLVVNKCMNLVEEMVERRIPASEYSRRIREIMLSNEFIVSVSEDVDGNATFTIPEEILNTTGWKEGDRLTYIDKGDGSYIIKKVEDDK